MENLCLFVYCIESIEANIGPIKIAAIVTRFGETSFQKKYWRIDMRQEEFEATVRWIEENAVHVTLTDTHTKIGITERFVPDEKSIDWAALRTRLIDHIWEKRFDTSTRNKPARRNRAAK